MERSKQDWINEAGEWFRLGMAAESASWARVRFAQCRRAMRRAGEYR